MKQGWQKFPFGLKLCPLVEYDLWTSFKSSVCVLLKYFCSDLFIIININEVHKYIFYSNKITSITQYPLWLQRNETGSQSSVQPHEDIPACLPWSWHPMVRIHLHHPWSWTCNCHTGWHGCPQLSTIFITTQVDFYFYIF